MAILTVTNTDNAGAGSLRDAIAQARANGTGADTIIFDSALRGETIYLEGATPTTRALTIASGTVTIDGDINGNGRADITISGDSNRNGISDTGDATILAIASGSTVTLDSVNITAGRGISPGVGFNATPNASAIMNSGNFTLNNSSVSDGVSYQYFRGGGASAITNFGTMLIENSEITGNYSHGMDGRGSKYGPKPVVMRAQYSISAI